MSDDTFPPAQRVDVGGAHLSVHAAGPEDGPLVVLLHGWPELAWSWKHQIRPIAALGFRVLAPDSRGFGASDAPDDPAAYRIDHLAADVTGLLDHAGAARAVVVGHDWGGALAWHFAMLRPDRTAGVGALATPHLPRPASPTSEALRARFGDDHYMLRFQEPGLAEARLGPARDELFAAFFAILRAPEERAYPTPSFESFMAQLAHADPAASVVPEADRAAFVEAYRRTGFTPGLNWYRNLDANWARMAGVDEVIRAPGLMISAERDPILTPSLTRRMPELVPDLELHVVPGAGHWIQWEAPEAVNALLCGWLERRFKER